MPYKYDNWEDALNDCIQEALHTLSHVDINSVEVVEVLTEDDFGDVTQEVIDNIKVTEGLKVIYERPEK